ncbi:hypothetical protein A2U01_0091732, partial [Trifolium medium]|nr:hypothetical protein [Trifolium medium]
TIPVTNGGVGSQGVSTGPDGNASHAVEDVQLVCPIPNQATATIAHSEDESAQRYKVLEEKLKAIEGFSAFGIDASDMCLVP